MDYLDSFEKVGGQIYRSTTPCGLDDIVVFGTRGFLPSIPVRQTQVHDRDVEWSSHSTLFKELERRGVERVFRTIIVRLFTM